MISLGISDSRYAESTERVVSMRPILCPPRIERDMLFQLWAVSSFVYIDLHGVPGDPSWLYADGKRVLHIGDVERLPSLVVFTTTCYLKMTNFYNLLRGSHTLICGDGRNYGTRGRAIGAPLLALWFRRVYEKTHDVELSLRVAKSRLALTSWARRSDRDALKFYIAPPIRGRQGEKNG